MAARSGIECTRYLLSNGVDTVLTQKFCTDELEEHFGRHRGLGQRNENPNFQQFTRQEEQLRMQRDLAFQMRPTGNTAGRRAENRRNVEISTSPLKKITYSRK